MSRNKELFKWLFISIGIFLLSFAFLYVYNRIDSYNSYYTDFEYLDDVSSDGKNAHLYLNGYNSQFIYVMPYNDLYSYYVYSDNSGNGILVKVNEEDARSCGRKYYHDSVDCYLEGAVFPMDDTLKEEITTKMKKYGYYLELDNLYLDTEIKLYRDNDIYWLLYVCCICTGFIGILISLVLLIKENLVNIKNNKANISKWIFRLSFLVYGIILMVV